MTSYSDSVRRPAWLLVLLLLLGASCAAYRSVPVDRASEYLEPGDGVRVLTRSDRELEFELVSLERDALVGAEQRVAYADIKFLWRRDVESGTKAVVLVALVIAAGLLFEL